MSSLQTYGKVPATGIKKRSGICPTSLLYYGKKGLLALLLHLSLQLCEYVEITESGACCNVLNLWRLFLLGTGSLLGGCLLLLTSGILEGTAVREDNALAVLGELNHLELECLTSLSL